MPDLRYHVISLIAVFFALAIGVLLGTAMSDNGVLEAQLRASIDDIRRDLDRQQALLDEKNTDIAGLQEEAATDREILESMATAMISDRLEGVTVALVAGPYADDGLVQSVRRDLSTAGASVAIVTRLDPPEPGTGGEEPFPEPESIYAEETQRIAALAMAPEDSSGGLLGESADPVEVVIFLGGGDPPPETPQENLDALSAAEEAMFEALRRSGLRVVAAETSDSVRSEVPLFQDAGLSSVDNAESTAGRAALILLTAGVAEGTYGVRTSASDLFPPGTSTD